MFLTRVHRRTLRALGETLFPSTGPDDPSGAAIVPDAVESLVAAMDPSVQRKVWVVLGAFELAAIAQFGHRFSNLPAEQQTRYVEGWMRSRFAPRRVVYRTIRGICANAYYSDERVWPVLGYDGPLLRRKVAS